MTIVTRPGGIGLTERPGVIGLRTVGSQKIIIDCKGWAMDGHGWSRMVIDGLGRLWTVIRTH